jgi:phage terminase large subunit
MWIEEASEVTAEDFRQLDIRMRGKSKLYKQIMLTFNPVSVTHWLKSDLVDRERESTTVIHSTYKDNKFLDREAIEVLEGFKDTDEYYYQVYCLGQWGVLGKTIFPARIVNERIHEIKDRKPLKRGFFVFEYENEKIIDSTIQWVDDPDGYISIYEEPQVGYPYVLGGDTAGEGSDYFTGHVLNNVTGNQVAVLRNQFDEDLYARQIYCLGKWYNEALVGIEANFSTHPIKELRRLLYPRQFSRKKEDTFTGKITKAYGFQTSKVTRPLVIAALVQVVREHPELINDLPTLNEMLTFVRNEQGRPEAQQGAHDDLIMGLAIAHYIRDQQSYSAEPSNAIYAGGIAPRHFEDDDLDEEELWEIPGFFG